MSSLRVPSLPELLQRKISKTGQTRGADDDEIYQNRVNRSNTVLIPYGCWGKCGSQVYENGFIVLLSPEQYFADPNISAELSARGLALGVNALVFYERRGDWDKYNPQKLGWRPARRRRNPLGGNYVARVPATTALENGKRIVAGFERTSNKGAGIRVYEYASAVTIADCRHQLEALFWLCEDSERVAIANGMSAEDVLIRKRGNLDDCRRLGLLDLERLQTARILDAEGKTVCPLCLERLSSSGFFTRMAQAEGRIVHDLTITELNLFHISELRYGALNHGPYNVGWGHHHCNVVVKDSGIVETLKWMKRVVERNSKAGHLLGENSPS